MAPHPVGCFGPLELRAMFEAFERAKHMTGQSPDILADAIIAAAMRGEASVEGLVAAAIGRPPADHSDRDHGASNGSTKRAG